MDHKLYMEDLKCVSAAVALDPVEVQMKFYILRFAVCYQVQRDRRREASADLILLAAQTCCVNVLQVSFCSNRRDKWLSHICSSEIRLVDQMNDTYLEHRPLTVYTALDSASKFNDTSR